MQSTAALAASSRLDALLAAIQPSPSSEFRRLTIAHFIVGVIKRCFQPHHQVRNGSNRSAGPRDGGSTPQLLLAAIGRCLRYRCIMRLTAAELTVAGGGVHVWVGAVACRAARW